MIRNYFRSLLTRSIHRKFSALLNSEIQKTIYEETEEDIYFTFVTKTATYVFSIDKLFYEIVEFTSADENFHVTELKVEWDSYEESYIIIISGVDDKGDTQLVKIVYESVFMDFPYPWRGVAQYKYSNITIDSHLEEMKPLGVARKISNDDYSLGRK